MIPALFIILAAIFKAVADTLKDHYGVSVFKKLNEKYWNPNISWQYVKFIKFTKYRPDPWHIANSCMIICFLIATGVKWYYAIGLGILFNLTFNLFYNRFLKSKS